jgi:acyl carrier protein
MGEEGSVVSVKERVLAVVREVLALDQNSKNILDASFKDDLTLTSLEQLTLFIALEDEFDRSIPQEEVAHIDTIQEVIEYVEIKLSPTMA